MAKPSNKKPTTAVVKPASAPSASSADALALAANSSITPDEPYVHDAPVIRFMRFRKPMAIISFLVVFIGLVSLVTRGLNLGLDFTGGVTAEINYAQPVDINTVAEKLKNSGFKDPLIQNLGTQKDLLVRMPPQHITDISAALSTALQLPNNPVHVNKVDAVGSQIGNELYLRSFGAVALALVLMLIYVTIRFEIKLAIGAVISLLHDTLFTVGIFSIFHFPFDLSVLAAVLALIGYSLNDTIVVFDRVRENFRKLRGATPVDIVDISLTETLSRTIMTVATVLLVVVSMALFGGEGLFWFSIAMLVGLFAGTYSSIYIATSYALTMGLKRTDFLVKVKPEFEGDDVVQFEG